MRDLKLFTSVVRSAKPWQFDPAVIPSIMENTPSIPTRKPVIGIIHQSGLTPHPPVRRAIREAQAKLAAAGYQTVDFTPPDFGEIRNITSQLFTVDGLSYPRRELSKVGEPVVPSVHNIGFWNMPAKTHEEMWEWNTKKGGMQKEMLDAWQTAGIDLVLAPAGPHTAVKPNHWMSDMYTVAWNAVDYPAVIIPFTNADPALDPTDQTFKPMNDLDAQIQALYDPETMAGAPVALQFVAPRLEDAALLRDVEILDQLLNNE